MYLDVAMGHADGLEVAEGFCEFEEDEFTDPPAFVLGERGLNVFEAALFAGVVEGVDGEVVVGGDDVVDALDDVAVVEVLEDEHRTHQATVLPRLLKLVPAVLLQGVLRLYMPPPLLVCLSRIRNTFPKVPSPIIRTHSKF
jgi:hypothetical protein